MPFAIFVPPAIICFIIGIVKGMKYLRNAEKEAENE